MNACASVHSEDIYFISELLLLSVRVITRAQGFLRGYKAAVRLSHCWFLLCGTMKHLIRDPHHVSSVCFPFHIKNNRVVLHNERGVEPTVYVKLGGVLFSKAGWPRLCLTLIRSCPEGVMKAIKHWLHPHLVSVPYLCPSPWAHKHTHTHKHT